MTWRPWLEGHALRQMQGLPSEAFDMLVRTLARAPIAGPGVNPRLLGTVTRTDLPGLQRVRQVTYAGLPLYRFFLDEPPGDMAETDGLTCSTQ